MQPDITPFVFRQPVSSATHLAWCVLGIYVTGLFWRLGRGDRVRQFSVACFGVCMTILYGASALYHGARVGEPYLHSFQLLDHSAIYLLIAGTYTPVCAVLLRGRLRIALLTSMWSLAVLLIVCKWLIQELPPAVTIGQYVALGWTGLIPVYYLIQAVGWRGMAWGLLGGLLYTFGAVCEYLRWPDLWPHVIGHHEIFHIDVMGATLVHIFFMLRYVLPFQR